MANDDTKKGFSEDVTSGHQPDNEMPSGDETDELFLKLKIWAESSRDHSRDWRKDAEEDYAFVAGDQWTLEDKSMLKEQMRPIITFNRIGVMVDSVAGMEVSNRQEVHYLPRQLGQQGEADLENAAAKWFRDNAMAEDEESNAFVDATVCGMGWLDTRLDYEEDPDGTAVVDRIDPLEMYWDPTAKKRNLRDRRYQMRAKQYLLSEAKDMFPDVPEEELHATWFDDVKVPQEPHDATEAKFYRNDQSGREAGDPLKKVLLVQAQWWEKEDYYRVADPQNPQKLVEFDMETGDKLVERAKKLGMPIQAVKSKRKVYKQAFVGKRILRVGPCPCPDHFSISPITAKRDRNKNSWYGIVRAMKDPQKWSNKFFSTLLHQFNTNGKGIMVETDAVSNPRNFEESWSSNDKVVWLKPGGAEKITPKPSAPWPTQLQSLMEYAISSIPQTTGINLELLGMTEREQPGILEYQRRQAGMTILAGLFDALRQYRKEQGEVLLYYIQHYFSDGRLIRIDGENGKQYIPLLRQPGVAEYDVIVDEATTSPNQKEATWAMLQQLLPVLGKEMPPEMLGLMLPYMPLPEALTSKMAQMIQQKSQQPPQPSPKDQADMMKAQASVATSQSTIEKNRASAMRDLAQAGVSGPGPQENIMSAAVDALAQSAGSQQDHQQQMQQNAQQHGQSLQQMQLDHQHQLEQLAMKQAHAKELAAMQPQPETVQ